MSWELNVEIHFWTFALWLNSCIGVSRSCFEHSDSVNYERYLEAASFLVRSKTVLILV